MTRRLWAALSVAALIAAGGLASGGGPAGAAFPGINGLLTFAEGPSGKGTVATVSADGTGQIFPVLLEAGAKPTWSPDGSKIAYTHYTGPHWQIWVMNADGTNPTQVTHVNVGDPGGAATPAWSPDGTKIAYSTSDYDQIWVVNADGSHPAQITHDEGGPVWFPESISWSPDGTKIAYDRNGAEIWVMNADGTNPSKLTEGAHPDWSPDGTKIAYDHQLVIWVMNADGTNRTQITDGTKGSGLDPAWSPDGTKIAFDAPVPLGQFEQIWLMNADGTDVHQLFATNKDAHDPDWQPIPTSGYHIGSGPSTTTTQVPGSSGPTSTVETMASNEARPATPITAQPTFTG